MYIPLRIVIADDHEIFRNGFKVLLKNQQDVELVGEAGDGVQLLELVATLAPDVVLLDIQMPVLDGVQTCRALRSEYPELPVIALTTFNEDSYIIDMLNAGARGYLLKNTNQDELLQAVKAVWNGRTYYCSATSQKLAQLINECKFQPNKPAIKFTERELEIIRLICKQRSNKEIATELNISVRTVESHRERIQEKIGSRNTTGIALYAVKHKICDV